MKVGVLALQGAFQRHADALGAAGAQPVEVRGPGQLAEVAALVIPGGESTTIGRLIVTAGLAQPLADRLAGGMPAFGTCAGMILLAAEILDGRPDQHPLGAIDISVRRNAFGRQVDSFEAMLAIDGLDVDGLAVDVLAGGEFPATFIRAPAVERAGPGVEVLARVGGRPVLCRQARVLVSAFHPELSADLRLHELFLQMAR